ncbi:MAG: serine--tRNA ligase [Candidatus Liptonbacteria bacterium]|nr:serine--tRNA ligase [Candidatus Liptonbacteria bacterium]
MIDINLLRTEPEQIRKGILAKNADAGLADKFLELDQRWRQVVTTLDSLRANQNRLSRERKIEEAKQNKEEIKKQELELAGLETERTEVLRLIPNPPLAEVPPGKSEADNVTLREVGDKPQSPAPFRDYLELAEPLGLIDTARAAKVSGSRFGYILGALVKLEFAMFHFGLKTLTDKKIIHRLIRENHLKLPDNPFTPVLPPVLVSRQSMQAMGYMERGGDEIYHLPADDMFLVGTSEQSLAPMHMDETLPGKELPKRYVGYSTCFRREAGSYGKDTRGIIRVHQFNKMEMLVLCTPETSRAEHRLILAIEEYLMQELKLPYRVLNICSADLGDPAAAKFDLEAWLPGQNGGQGEYRETHSASNCTDYQARRLNIRYQPIGDKKNPSPKPEFVHILNGTVFSERPLIAIIENYQTPEGKVRVPDVLQKYVGEKVIG